MNVSNGGTLPRADSPESGRRFYLFMRRRGHHAGLRIGPKRGKPHITLKAH
jgi:hypothetical protein